jgi:RHS repeat-associated protein
MEKSSDGRTPMHEAARCDQIDVAKLLLDKGADLMFTGQNQDTATNSGGLYDFLFREYGTREGRWISPDPVGWTAVDISNPQTWNRYAYVLNNPLSAVDPLGLDCEGAISNFSSGDLLPGSVRTNVSQPCPAWWDLALEGGWNLTSSFLCGSLGICGSQEQTPPAVNPPTPSKTNCGSGFGGGVGLTLGGGVEAGNGMEGQGGVAAILNANFATGGFFDNQTGFSKGGALTGAAAVNAGSGAVTAAPSQDLVTPSAFGGFAGGGLGMFVTNARSINQLSDHFKTLSFNAGVGPAQLSVQWAKAGSTWELSASFPFPGWGGGLGASGSTFTSNTIVRGGENACK